MRGRAPKPSPSINDGASAPHRQRHHVVAVLDGPLQHGVFKLEVEALISKGVSFVTEEYVPARLAAQDWLD